MTAWIKTHQSLGTHRKTLALADELGTSVPAAVGHLVLLWCWALDNAPGGFLGHIRPKTIAVAAMWRKRPGDFLAALVTAGFVDEPQDGPLSLHDWDEYAGRLMYQRARNRANVSAHRKRLQDGDAPVTSPSRVEKRREEESSEDEIPPYPPQAGGRRRSAGRRNDPVTSPVIRARIDAIEGRRETA